MIRDILRNEFNDKYEKYSNSQLAFLRNSIPLRNNLYSRDEINEFLDNIDKLIKLWDEPKNRYEKLLNNLNNINIKINEEESIEVLNCVINYLHEIGAIDDWNKDYLYNINEVVE